MRNPVTVVFREPSANNIQNYPNLELEVEIKTLGSQKIYFISELQQTALLRRGFSVNYNLWTVDEQPIHGATKRITKGSDIGLLVAPEPLSYSDQMELKHSAPKLLPGVIGTDFIGVTMSFFCVDEQDRLVMHLRNDKCRDEHFTWDTGSGQLEFLEDTMEDAVLREISEEYGCNGSILKALPATNIIRSHNGNPTHWVSIPFIVRVNSEDVKIGEPEKMDKLGFFTLFTLPAPLQGCTRKLLDTHYQIISEYVKN